MQQRFCKCGFSIWVQYLFSEAQCHTVFWSTIHGNGFKLSRCPSCGKSLSIDELC
jgi:hypothetical protein